MDCESARDQFVELLTGRLAPPQASDVERHIAGCEACRTETTRLRELWAELGDVTPPTPNAAVAGRVGRLVDARMSAGAQGTMRASTDAPTRGHGWGLGLAAVAASLVAASLIAGLLVGRNPATVVTDAQAPTARPSVASDGERYLLLLRDAADEPKLSASEMNARVAEYGAWAGKLAREGSLVLAEKLADVRTGALLTASGTTPYSTAEAAQAVGGFFLIRAADAAAAERIARECPHLKYGGVIELRRIEPT